MRLRNAVALIAAVLLAALLGMVPAKAVSSPCPPACAVSGTVVGSVIRPPFDLNIRGTILDDISGNTYRFRVEGPYNFTSAGFARGTVKVEGPGSPNGQYMLWANASFEGSINDFTMHNAGPSNVLIGGHFQWDASTNALVGDHVTLDSNPDFGGGDGGPVCCVGGT
jgi:hypothetical protein